MELVVETLHYRLHYHPGNIWNKNFMLVHTCLHKYHLGPKIVLIVNVHEKKFPNPFSQRTTNVENEEVNSLFQIVLNSLKKCPIA